MYKLLGGVYMIHAKRLFWMIVCLVIIPTRQCSAPGHLGNIRLIRDERRYRGGPMKKTSKKTCTAFIVGMCAAVWLILSGCPAAEDPLPYPLDLPKTGQTTVHEAGDDGDLRKGVAWPSPRFSDNEDGTVTDLLTGLMWTQDGDASTYIDWEPALTYCNNLDHAGYDDWRLPNIKELQSLVNFEYEYTSTWLNSVGFVDIRTNDEYWSGTTDGYDTSNAKIVDMGSDVVIQQYSKTSSAYVLAVRSETDGTISLPKTGQTTSYAAGDDGDLRKGVEWPAERFVDNGDNTIADTLTGLMWPKHVTSNQYSFADAITYCQSLPGYSDWRLPNVLEWESLINYEEGNQEAWLVGNGFTGFANPVDQFWTSTTAAYNTNYRWVIYTDRGEMDSGSADQYVIAVRSAE